MSGCNSPVPARDDSPVPAWNRRCPSPRNAAAAAPRHLDPLPDRGRTFPQAVAAQLLVVHARDFDVDVDPLKTCETFGRAWDGDALLILGYYRMGTRTGLLCIAIPAARAGLHTKTLFLLFVFDKRFKVYVKSHYE